MSLCQTEDGSTCRCPVETCPDVVCAETACNALDNIVLLICIFAETALVILGLLLKVRRDGMERRRLTGLLMPSTQLMLEQ